MNLYEMTTAARNLYELLSEGEIDEQTVKDNLEAIGTEEKLESYCKVIRTFQSDVEALKAEKLRLAEKQARCERAIARMKEAVSAYLGAVGKDSESAGVFTVSLRPFQHVEINGDLPEEYYVYRDPRPDKDMIRKALQEGKQLNATLVTENRVQIK